MSSVWNPKGLFPDPDPTFQIIPDSAPDPDPFPDLGQNQIFERTQNKKIVHIIQKCLELDSCTVFKNFSCDKNYKLWQFVLFSQ